MGDSRPDGGSDSRPRARAAPPLCTNNGALKDLRVAVIGGSIAGLASAVGLLQAGASDVRVYERTEHRLSRGAGVGLDDVSVAILSTLVASPDDHSAVPRMMKALKPMRLTHELSARTSNTLLRSPYPYYAAHWGMVYDSLLEALQRLGGQVYFGMKLVEVDQGEFNQAEPLKEVHAKLDNGDTVVADLLLGADGPHSKIQLKHFPQPKPLSYQGRVAWRGVMQRDNLSSCELDALNNDYPDLGNCLYFIVGQGQHVVLYELGGGLINWLLYVNRDTPLFANRTTGEVPEGMLEELCSRADSDWGPGLGGLIRATPNPFANDIYDRDVIPTYVHGAVALVGDSAHPTTPHMAKGTNLALQDAYVLSHHVGSSYRGAAAGGGNDSGLRKALEDYDSQRRPEGTRLVSVSRHMGLVRNSQLDGPTPNFNTMLSEEYDALTRSVGVDIRTLPLDPFLSAFAEPLLAE